MTTTETRLLPKELVDGIAQALTRLRFVCELDKDHPVIPPRREYCKGVGFRPHPVDCDVCVARRRLDLFLDAIIDAIGHAPKGNPCEIT